MRHLVLIAAVSAACAVPMGSSRSAGYVAVADEDGADQAFDSNEPCRFVVDGRSVASGRRVTIRISPDRPHTVTCQAEGYKDKTETVYPPYGDRAVSFFFMMEDRENAAPSWEEKHAREQVQDMARASRYNGYGELGAGVAQAMRASIKPSVVVAVMGFVNRDTNKVTRFSARLQDEIIGGLVDQNVRVVKRDRLEVLQQEMRHQEESGMVDERTAVKLGQMAGARKIVTGTYVDLPGDGVVKVRAELVDIESGQIEKSFSGELLRSTEVLQAVEK
jgi:hypothetical protein